MLLENDKHDHMHLLELQPEEMIILFATVLYNLTRMLSHMQNTPTWSISTMANTNDGN